MAAYVRDHFRKVVCLDKNMWIMLAQAATGHPKGHTWKDALAACRLARQRGTAIFPLSNSTYVEVSKIRDPRQRQHLATLMEVLSGFESLINPLLLKRIEMDAVLDADAGTPASGRAVPRLGPGVGFAFGRAIRPRIHNTATDEDITSMFLDEVPEGAELLSSATLMMERAVLVGPSDAEVPALRALGWDPGAAWNVAEERAAEERGQAARFDERVGNYWRRGRLRDVIGAREILIEFGPVIKDVVAERGPDTLDSWFDRKYRLRSLVRAMPPSEVSVEMKTALHRDAVRARRWSPNDVIDIDMTSLAVPYCDVMVTEQHVHHVITTAHLGDRMGTVMLRDLRDLPPLIF